MFNLIKTAFLSSALLALLVSLLLKMLCILLLLSSLLNQVRDQRLQPPPHGHIAFIKIAVKNNIKFSNCLPRTLCECKAWWWRREGDRGQQLRVVGRVSSWAIAHLQVVIRG